MHRITSQLGLGEMPKKELKTASLTMRISEDVKIWLVDSAAKQDRSLAYFTEIILRKAMETDVGPPRLRVVRSSGKGKGRALWQRTRSK